MILNKKMIQVKALTGLFVPSSLDSGWVSWVMEKRLEIARLDGYRKVTQPAVPLSRTKQAMQARIWP